MAEVVTTFRMSSVRDPLGSRKKKLVMLLLNHCYICGVYARNGVSAYIIKKNYTQKTCQIKYVL